MSELRGCVKVEVSVLGSPSVIVPTVSVDVYQHSTRLVGPFCFTSTEARWVIRDGDREGRGRKSEGSTEDTARKRPERPWTAARTMEVLRRCFLTIAQRLVHCAIAVSTASGSTGRVTRTMSVALLLRNNSKRKKSNFRSPAPPPYS